jgi:hypothetical protein
MSDVTGYSEIGECKTPVILGTDGYFNVGTVAGMNIEDFAQFAADVIMASNTITGKNVSLPSGRPLVDMGGTLELIELIENNPLYRL